MTKLMKYTKGNRMNWLHSENIMINLNSVEYIELEEKSIIVNLNSGTKSEYIYETLEKAREQFEDYKKLLLEEE